VAVEPVQTVKQYYRVDRRQIAFLRFIIEAYEGIAVMQTLDPQAGLIVLHIAPGCEADVDLVLEDLKKEIRMQRT